MNSDRFHYTKNLKKATQYQGWSNVFWPPANDYYLFCLDITTNAPRLDKKILVELVCLRRLIEAEWQTCNTMGVLNRTDMRDANSIASCLRRIASLLSLSTDREALELRANAIENGYDDVILAKLTKIDENIAFIAGHISTWYGKQVGGLPTAFGCVRDPFKYEVVAAAQECLDQVATYLRTLHTALRLGDVPAFLTTNLFFMAGEGNRHPKHIAYFLPEDEGIKHSPFKKTYYFSNAHHALLNNVSLPHARRLLAIDHTTIATDATELEPIPTLSVLAHEIGHFVYRQGISFAELNATDRWVSVLLQEVVADVFGLLIVVEVFSPIFHFSPADAVAYHLAESLRYIDRGLGCFPDSDGMYLQINYLTAFGALRFEEKSGLRLVGDSEVILAGFLSLARVLADTILDGDVERSIALHRDYGPASSYRLVQLINLLKDTPPKTIEYLQEPEKNCVDASSVCNTPTCEKSFAADHATT